IHGAEGRHAVAHRARALRQGQRMAAHLRRQPRPAGRSRPDPARPGPEDPGRAPAGRPRHHPAPRSQPMSPHPLPAPPAAALLGTLALAAGKKDEPATPPPVATPAPAPAPAPEPAPAPAPAPVTVTSVDLGSEVDANNRVTSPKSTFSPTDTIHASVSTTSADPSTPQTGTLTARWTYEGGQLVDETSRDYNFTGTGQTAFQVSKPDGWPTGNYRVEILYDGEVVQTRDFEVR